MVVPFESQLELFAFSSRAQASRASSFRLKNPSINATSSVPVSVPVSVLVQTLTVKQVLALTLTETELN